MKDKYKNKKWLKYKLVDENIAMSEIAKLFNKDTSTIWYWKEKFNISLPKNVKYPIKNYQCPVCGKEFKKRDTKNSQSVYCSSECAYKGRSLGYTERKVENGYNTSPTKIELTCALCDKTFIVDKTNKTRKYCSRECFLEVLKDNMKGENNPAWINGNSYNKRTYRGPNWKTQRKECYKRDKYICQICGVKCRGRKYLGKNGKNLIQCHHIEKYKSEEDNCIDNLITLCASCHKKLHEGVINYEMD